MCQPRLHRRDRLRDRQANEGGLTMKTHTQRSIVRQIDEAEFPRRTPRRRLEHAWT